MDISDITAADLQDDIIGRIIIHDYREQATKAMEDGGYMNILAGNTGSVFQDFESYLRTEVDLVEDDVRLVLDKYNSSFITYELETGIYNFKGLSKALYNVLQLEYPESSSEIVIENDDITMKTKLVERSRVVAINRDEKSVFNTPLGFTPGWDYKHYNEYTSQKIVNLKSTNKIHLKCDDIDGSVENGSRQPILFSLVSDKPSGYKVFCEPETIHYKKINESVLNTITSCLEDDNNEEFDFNAGNIDFYITNDQILNKNV